MRTILIHCGQGKTGTTAIQRYMAKNRQQLAKQGILFPRSPGRRRHSLLSLFGLSDERMIQMDAWNLQKFNSPSELREYLSANLPDELRKNRSDKVVFSDEAIYGGGAPVIGAIRNLLAGEENFKFSYLIYLRRQDQRLVSWYKQKVRRGAQFRLSDLLSSSRIGSSWNYHANLSNIA